MAVCGDPFSALSEFRSPGGVEQAPRRDPHPRPDDLYDGSRGHPGL